MERSSPGTADDAGDVGSEGSLTATLAARPVEPRVEPEPLPQTVGRYRIEALLGEGAMGMVLRAHDPRLGRVVALKLLHARASRANDHTAQRLRREAQALARLSHPNVVDVFDVGTEDGRIFVAMEHVAGRTLGAWLAEARPARAAVIDAFVQAGRGLAAAHRAGLVHRDFKPANVLRGDDGRVRVVDFGLAAPPRDSEGMPTAGSQDGDAVDVRVTATGFVVGTPAYMAPEAHRGGPIDARSDQFSFCVALYEALYGERPFRGGTVQELFDRARAGEIAVPAGADVPAALRDVVLRGLRPAPDERWPAMDALLEQLEPRRRGRARAWAGALALAGPVGLAVALARDDPAPEATCEHAQDAVAEVWGAAASDRVHTAFVASALPYAERAWQRTQAQLDAHAAALGQARRMACEARMTAAVPPEQLDRRMACLGRRLAELRGAVAVLEQADAATVRNAAGLLGDLRDLGACDDEALAAAVAPPPATMAAEVERAHDDLARVRALRRAGDYDEARALARDVIARVEPLGYPPLLAEARLRYASVLDETGEWELAEQELGEAVMLAQAAGHDALVAEASTHLVFIVGSRLRRPEDAERWVRHARAAIDRLTDPREAETFLEGTLGNYHVARGELAEARVRFERTVRAREQHDGPRHPTTIVVRGNLAMVQAELGDYATARAQLERVLADRIEVYGPEHPDVATTYGNLAVIEQQLGELDAALEHGRRALALVEASVGREHPNYAQLLVNLSNTEYRRGNRSEAVRMQEQAKALLVQTLGPREFLVGRTLSNLGGFYTDMERYDEARQALRQAREILEEHLSPVHPELGAAISNLARVELATGRFAEALAGFDEAIALLEASKGHDHLALANELLGRGEAQLGLARHAAALVDLRRAVEVLERAQASPEPLAAARSELAEALWIAGERAEAIGEMERARALVEGVVLEDEQLRTKIETWLRDPDGRERAG